MKRTVSSPITERRSETTNVAKANVEELPPPTAALWSATQTRVAELVWGKGYLAPGGAQRVVDLVKPLGLTPAVTLLELGAGPGGSTHAIAKKFGTYVTAFVTDPDHAKIGTELAVAHDVDKKVSIRCCAPPSLKLKSNYFHGAFVYDYIRLVQDKDRLIQEIARSVKPRGQVVIVDLFSAADPQGPGANAWTKNNFVPVSLCTSKRLSDDLKRCGLDPYICEDESEVYSELAHKAWGEFLRSPEAESLPAELRRPMLESAECWTLLLAAIRSGDVRYTKIVAVKRGG